jgi:hypothetical protein
MLLGVPTGPISARPAKAMGCRSFQDTSIFSGRHIYVTSILRFEIQKVIGAPEYSSLVLRADSGN